MTRMVWRETEEKPNGTWVDRDLVYPKKYSGIQYIPEIADYESPMGGVVTNRMERREDLKIHGCREVDPGEFKVEFHNRRYAEQRGHEWSGKTDHPDHVPGGSGPRTLANREGNR